MSEFKFIKYEATPTEKHLGIMTVSVIEGNFKIILRYKIVKTKDGNAIFPSAPSYKMSGEGEDARYITAFCLDSHADQELLLDFVKEKMMDIMSKSHQKLNTFEERILNSNFTQGTLKTPPSRSNAEIEETSSLPF